MNLAKKLYLILTIHCDQAAQLTSESFERRLYVHERIAIRCHQLGCWSCRQFEKQLRFLSASVRRLQRVGLGDEPSQRLSTAFKMHLKSLRFPTDP